MLRRPLAHGRLVCGLLAIALGCALVAPAAGATPAAAHSSRWSFTRAVSAFPHARHATTSRPDSLTPPAQNIPPNPDWIDDGTCTEPVDNTIACELEVLASINHARAEEGVGAMKLPSNYGSISTVDRMMTILNIERVDRGLAPMAGIANNLDADAATEVSFNGPPDPIANDPNYPADWEDWVATLLPGPSALAADYLGMYDDGPGGIDSTCPAGSNINTNSNCWLFRSLDLVDTSEVTGTPAFGAAQGLLSDSNGTFSAWSSVIVVDPRQNPPFGFTWAQELPFVYGPPVETSVTPPSGAASGGEAITINGRNMLEVTEVDFGSNGAGSGLVLSHTGTSLTVAVPPSSTSGAVAITLKSTGGTVSAGHFTYNPSVPAAPPAVYAASLGSGGIAVSWSPPATGGSAITGYVVSPTCATSVQPVTVSGSTTATNLTGFTAGLSCAFRVVAKNGLGSGTGTTSSTVVEGPLTPSQKFVMAAFTDFLNRLPVARELSIDATGVGGGTLTRSDVVSQLASSTEWVTNIVQQLYQNTLGRPGDSGGVTYWVGQIRTGAKSVAQVAANFYASDEYFNNIGGGTNSSWITDLYNKLLLRAPDTAGLNYWVGQTVSQGRPTVAYRFYQSEESADNRVNQLYEKLLGRAADPAGLSYWSGQVVKTGDISLAANLASSSEYYNRAQTRF